jgi:DNA mismatch endonuclease, patch repair protein
MADVHSPATRSYNMSRIKGKNTKPEMIVRRYLFANGFRYRLHVKELPGKPDLVLKRYRTVIFVHGCFWHGHEGCPYFVIPKTRTEWWTGKLNKNRENDEKARNQLIAQGWKVVLIWECELKRFNMNHTLNTLIQNLKVHDADTRN